MDNDLLVSINTRPDPSKCVLVFDLAYDDDMEQNVLVISNYKTAKTGYLIDCYTDEEGALLEKFEDSDIYYGNMMESIYEYPEGKTKDEIIDGMIDLGFGYMPGFMKSI